MAFVLLKYVQARSVRTNLVRFPVTRGCIQIKSDFSSQKTNGNNPYTNNHPKQQGQKYQKPVKIFTQREFQRPKSEHLQQQAPKEQTKSYLGQVMEVLESEKYEKTPSVSVEGVLTNLNPENAPKNDEEFFEKLGESLKQHAREQEKPQQIPKKPFQNQQQRPASNQPRNFQQRPNPPPQTVPSFVAEKEKPVNELLDFLTGLNLSSYHNALRDLGATTVSDLEFLQENDLDQIGLKLIEKRKLLASVKVYKSQPKSVVEVQPPQPQPQPPVVPQAPPAPRVQTATPPPPPPQVQRESDAPPSSAFYEAVLPHIGTGKPLQPLNVELNEQIEKVISNFVGKVLDTSPAAPSVPHETTR